MVTADQGCTDSDFRRFGNDVIAASNAVLYPMAFARFYLWAVRLLSGHRKLLDLVHWRMSACVEVCDSAPCLRNLSANVEFVINALSALSGATEKSFLFMPLRRPIRNVISDWEDVHEDLAVFSDPEIRSLITAIADGI
jgi:hypothetical protein